MEPIKFENTLKFQLKNKDHYTRMYKTLNYTRYEYNKSNNTHLDFILSRNETFETTLMIDNELLQPLLSELVKISYLG
jgi:hypothetical protein